MNENDYLKIRDQMLKLRKDDIVRSFDDAFLKRWKKYMWEERGRLMAEAFVIPLFACWFLWYIFGDFPQNHRLLEFSILAILLCASLHYALTIRHHKEWELDRFTADSTGDVIEECMEKCKPKMLEQAITAEEAEAICIFFEIAAHDPHIGVSMHRVWLDNSRKMK